jgi:hypothetical protein
MKTQGSSGSGRYPLDIETLKDTLRGDYWTQLLKTSHKVVISKNLPSSFAGVATRDGDGFTTVVLQKRSAQYRDWFFPDREER